MKEKKKVGNAKFDDLNIVDINNVYLNMNLTKASRNLFCLRDPKKKMVGSKDAIIGVFLNIAVVIVIVSYT